jgi:hypothetical protein
VGRALDFAINPKPGVVFRAGDQPRSLGIATDIVNILAEFSVAEQSIEIFVLPQAATSIQQPVDSVRGWTTYPVQNFSNCVDLARIVWSWTKKHVHVVRHHDSAVNPCTASILSFDVLHHHGSSYRREEYSRTHRDEESFSSVLQMREVTAILVPSWIVNRHWGKDIGVKRDYGGERHHFARSRASGLQHGSGRAPAVTQDSAGAGFKSPSYPRKSTFDSRGITPALCPISRRRRIASRPSGPYSIVRSLTYMPTNLSADC